MSFLTYIYMDMERIIRILILFILIFFLYKWWIAHKANLTRILQNTIYWNSGENFKKYDTELDNKIKNGKNYSEDEKTESNNYTYFEKQFLNEHTFKIKLFYKEELRLKINACSFEEEYILEVTNEEEEEGVIVKVDRKKDEIIYEKEIDIKIQSDCCCFSVYINGEKAGEYQIINANKTFYGYIEKNYLKGLWK